jgi:hypothetical protein
MVNQSPKPPMGAGLEGCGHSQLGNPILDSTNHRAHAPFRNMMWLEPDAESKRHYEVEDVGRTWTSQYQRKIEQCTVTMQLA